MNRYIILIVICNCFLGIAEGQYSVTNIPDSANIVTTDINHFWSAFDLLKSQRTTADSLKVIKINFVNQASEGLRRYMLTAHCHEREYLETIRKKKADYLAVRAGTEIITGEKQRILLYLKRFKQLYPALRIPVICFTIGKFQTGGTQFENTLYIGCEVDIINHIDVVPQCIHELAHFQQNEQKPITNLGLAMIEGGAEFICYQVTGKRTIPKAWVYGSAHESGLWNEFRPGIDSAINMKWFLDVPDKVKKRPGSLAYFIGFRICEAYLKGQENKARALKEVIEMKSPEKIFLASLYFKQ